MKNKKNADELAQELMDLASAEEKHFVNLWFEVLEAAFKITGSNNFSNVMKSIILVQSLYVKFMQQNWYNYFSIWQPTNSKKK
ncbi:MAG: hypothetical protein EAZ57_01205 [Cytophagales bacterium]|nr:MAG: hypothetical protein EAZ67_02070 [Cytophagales bacterium]TAF62067.1 MAG: hypothetical protein EAZ57_01205 [Cytophagales bacterium]